MHVDTNIKFLNISKKKKLKFYKNMHFNAILGKFLVSFECHSIKTFDIVHK